MTQKPIIRLVTFECRHCRQTFTVEQRTGRPPEVCLNCWPEYRKAQKTRYMRRWRAQKPTEG